jgi:signal transduction histidine kinase
MICLLSLSAHSEPLRHVLLLNSYHQGYAWTDDIVRGARDVLLAKVSPVDIDVEYRDSRRHEETAADYAFALFLQSKFAHLQPDLILASDDPAVEFVLHYRQELFPNVPTVFCGVNEYHGSSAYVTANPGAHPWLAGVLEQIDLEKTAEIALRLLPQTHSIVTIGELDDAHYDRDLARLYPNLQVRRISTQKLTLDEIGARVMGLPRDSIVILSAFSRDATKHFLSMKESIRFVCDRSPVPVFGLNKNALGWGIVGGKLTDGYAQGAAAAEMGVSVLRGAKPSELGIRWTSPNPYEFDWSQLVRWRIPASLLPAGSIIINRPKSFYALYRIWVWGGLCFIICQSFVLILLIVQQRRRKHAEIALAAHVEQLARSNYMLEQFAQVAAHDFQEPVRTVAVCSELLGRSVRGTLNPENERVLGYALGGAQRMYAMVRSLVDWVRAPDNLQERSSTADTAAVLHQVLETYRSTIEQTGAIITVDWLPCVDVPPAHLSQIWERLIDNALRYRGPDPPRIIIGANRTRAEWKFSVQDNGIGIPASAYERIFGVFKSLNRTDESRMGMGLAICRRIVHHYGGRIWVESQPGLGSIFYFTIPDDSRHYISKRTGRCRLLTGKEYES